MIFGFGRRNDDDDDEDDDEEEIDFVLFQGALNDNTPDLSANAKLVQAGLLPAKRLVTDALLRRAEMIRLETKGKVAAATFFIDGVPVPGERMPATQALAITQMLKLLAGLDIKVRNKPQAGGVKAQHENVNYHIRINTQPTEGGAERLIVRAQNQNIKLESPRDLGFSDALVDKLRGIGSSKQGLIVVAGMPFSGVTSATIATVRSVDAYLYSIYNLADLGGRDLAHINNFKWNPGDTLAQTMGRAKREDADVLLVDPIRDAETAKTIFEYTQHLAIVAEVQARDAADAIARVTAFAGDPALVAANLKMVISQMLIRLLCKKCRQAYRPNPKLLAKVGLPPETKVLYRPPQPSEEEGDEEEEPCEECQGLGYKGRTGLIEVFEMTEGLQKVVLAGADAKALRAQARAERMQSFQSDGLRVVAEGNTSLEELQRAFKSM